MLPARKVVVRRSFFNRRIRWCSVIKRRSASLRGGRRGGVLCWQPDCGGRRARDVAIAAIVKLIAPLAVVAVAATVLMGVFGLVLAKQTDDQSESAQREALRSAVEAQHVVSPAMVDAKLMGILESASGLRGLRLEEEPPSDARALQSMMDSNGRIVGWFVWEPEQPATALIARLWPFGVLIALGLFAFATLAIWQLRRLGVRQAQSAREVDKLTYEDFVTGLPNLHGFRAFLDRALETRRPEESVVVALIDLGGFEDMKDAVGDIGEDDVLIEIANRLRKLAPGGRIHRPAAWR